jgi:hypothetical protein
MLGDCTFELGALTKKASELWGTALFMGGPHNAATTTMVDHLGRACTIGPLTHRQGTSNGHYS